MTGLVPSLSGILSSFTGSGKKEERLGSIAGVPERYQSSPDSDVTMERNAVDDNKGTLRMGKARRRISSYFSQTEDPSITELRNGLEVLQKEKGVLQEKLDKSTSSCSTLQNALDESKKEIKTLRTQKDRKIRELEKDLGRSKEELERLVEELDGGEERVRRERSKNAQLTNDLNAKNWEHHGLKSQYDRLSTDYNSIHQKLLSSEKACERLKANLQMQETRFDDLKKRHDSTTELLEQRTKELKGAQEYLHSTRSYSGADLIRLIESLNGEIMQASGLITDALKIEEMASPRDRSTFDDVARQRLGLFLSEEMMGLFYTLKSDELEMLIQNAVQAAMVHCCQVFINAWSPYENVDHLLRSIYRKQDISSASCRWRSITKKHTKYDFSEALEENMRAALINSLASVLAISGWLAKDQEHETHVARVTNERISVVMRQSFHIDKIIGLEMTSEELEVFAAPLNKPFLDSDMEDVYGSSAEEAASANARVLCSTDIGLRCYKGGEDWQVMLKPKVVLNTVEF